MDPTALFEALGALTEGALVTPLARSGSVPTPENSRMFVLPSVQTEGTVGGGAVELRATNVAKDVIRSGRARVFRLRADSAVPVPLIDGPLGGPFSAVCGGAVTLLVEPLSDETASLFAFAAKEVALGHRCVEFVEPVGFSECSAGDLEVETTVRRLMVSLEGSRSMGSLSNDTSTACAVSTAEAVRIASHPRRAMG